MKRIVMLLAVAAMMVVMLLVMAAPALAQAEHHPCGSNAVGHLVTTPQGDLRGHCILRL